MMTVVSRSIFVTPRGTLAQHVGLKGRNITAQGNALGTRITGFPWSP